jgi:MFS family permease
MTIHSLLLDIRPQRESTPFRRLWIGSTLSGFGSQIASFAVLFYIWTLTGNAALVGLTGLAQAVPMFVFALIGGQLADWIDRRRLVLLTRCGQLAASAGMAAVVIAGSHAIIVIYLLIALQTGLSALSAPASKAFIPRLLAKEQLSAGFALNSISMQGALLVGPLVAGLAITAWGVNGCFLFDAITYLASIYGVFGLPSMPPEATGGKASRSALAGLRFVARTPILIGAFLADLNATVLAMPVALFPVINSEKFGGSAATLGLFLPALAIGGVIAGTLSGRITRSARPGIIMLIAGGVWAAGLAAFAAIDVVGVAIPFLALAGAADAISVIARGTIVQHITPDAYRGRVNALDFVVGAAGPQVGNIRAGLVAAATSGSESMIVGGIAAAIGTALIAIFTPALRHYRLESEPAAVPSG